MKPERPYRALRAVVGTAVVATFVSVWVHSYLVGDPLGTLWDVVVLALLFASAIAVFGRNTVTEAVDEVEALQGDSDSGDDT